jgi:hypothetical protein
VCKCLVSLDITLLHTLASIANDTIGISLCLFSTGVNMEHCGGYQSALSGRGFPFPPVTYNCYHCSRGVLIGPPLAYV